MKKFLCLDCDGTGKFEGKDCIPCDGKGIIYETELKDVERSFGE